MTSPETYRIKGRVLAVPEASLTQPVPVGDGRVGSRDSVARACEALAVPCYGPTFDS